MAKQRRTYTNEFKARIALEALTGEKTLNELAGEKEEITSPLFQQIGQLKVENDWLKKKLGPLPLSLISKCSMIESDNDDLSVKKQSALIKLSRGTWYDRQDLSREKSLTEEKKKHAEKEMSDRILSIYAERISLAVSRPYLINDLNMIGTVISCYNLIIHAQLTDTFKT